MAETSNENATEIQTHRRNRVGTVGRVLIGAGLLILGFVAGEYTNGNAGAKNGITAVSTEGCQNDFIYGPHNTSNGKVTDIIVTGSAAVEFYERTKTVPESALRNPGIFPTDILYTTIEVVCAPLPTVQTAAVAHSANSK